MQGVGGTPVALLMPHHHVWQLGQAQTAAAGGADRRSAQGAGAPLNQSRQAHRSARPRRSPRRAIPKAYRRQFKCSGCHRLIQPNLLVLLGSLSPAEMEPEEGFEPSTFRLRGDSEPESPNRWVRWRSSDKVAGKPGQGRTSATSSARAATASDAAVVATGDPNSTP